MWEGYCLKGLRADKPDIEWHEVHEKPFSIHGLLCKDALTRMSDEDSSKVSPAVHSGSASPAGGRIRFATDSPYIAIKADVSAYDNGSPHVTRLAYTGFDIYVSDGGRQQYCGSFYPPIDCEEYVEGIKDVGCDGIREFTVNLPLARAVKALHIGIKKGSVLKEHSEYRHPVPVAFYGSSITQGFAASRPGTAYESFISRKYDCDYYNFGYSGHCRGELAMADFLGRLDISLLVLDYDHNAPDTDNLKATHEPFFKRFRELKPDLPVIMVTKPDGRLLGADRDRRSVIMNTYLNAKSLGDENVYFIDGYSFFPDDVRFDCTVDGCHPNDLGMYMMADKIGTVIGHLLGK